MTLDASITLGNRIWDMAAGTLIARRAHAAVFDADGTPHDASSRFAIAASPALRDDILILAVVTMTTTPEALTSSP